MPKIRSYDSPQFEFQGQSVRSNADLSGSGAGKAMEQFGEQFSNMEESQYKRQAQNEVSDLNAKFSEARAEWATKIDEQTRDGSIDSQKLTEEYQNYTNKMSEGLQTNEGRRFFDQQSAGLGGYVLKNSARAQAVVAGDKAVSDISSSLNTSSTLLQRRPGDFQDVYQQTLHGIDAQMETGVIRQKEGEKLKILAGKELAKNAAYGLIRKSPGDAIRAMDRGDYDKYIDADNMRQLRSSAEAEIKSRQDQMEKIIALKDKDPWSFVQKTGQTQGLKPLDMGEGVTESFKDRAQFIQDADKKHGITLPFMSDREADHMTNQFMKMNPTEAVEQFQNIDTGVGDETKGKFALQVFKKEPALAVSLVTAADAPDDSRKILAGMALLRSKDGVGKAVQAPDPSSVQKAFDTYVGSAIADPGVRQATRQAILAHMIKEKFDNGDADFSEVNELEFQASAEKIIGPTVDMGGMKTISFRGKSGKFVSADDLSTLVDSLSDKRIEAVQGDVPRTMNGEPINMSKSRGRVGLRAVGDGLYNVILDGKKIAVNKNKQAFVLDLKAIEKAKPEKSLSDFGGMGGGY